MAREVLREFILKGNKRADDMLVRMFDGILHPLIHLGFGVEFEQPAIIAEALALAAVHDDWDAARLIESETIAKANDLDRRPDATIHSSSGRDLLGPKAVFKLQSQFLQ
jgi:hypothetical protein